MRNKIIALWPTENVEIKNKLGIHARTATVIVTEFSKCEYAQTQVQLRLRGHWVDATNFLDLYAGVNYVGDTVEVRAKGPRAQQAIERMKALFHQFLVDEGPCTGEEE